MRILTLVLTLLMASAAARAGAPIELKAPEPMPELAFETMDGSPATLKDLAGRVVVLNLWATWCAPCREEMPALDRLQAAFDPTEVLVLALSVDRAGPERVQAFLDEIGIERLAVYRDPRAATTRALKVPGLPATMIIDRDGHEVARVLGIAAWDGPEALAAIRAVLASG
jgi:thiol-disulfide isomerase/thioredoxin